MVHKMERAERAKQFMPFSALKGYEEALRNKEKIMASKVELSEDGEEELNRKLHQIRKNDIITVIYFYQEEYLQITGMVSKLDEKAKLLQIVDTQIPFQDIYNILLSYEI